MRDGDRRDDELDNDADSVPVADPDAVAKSDEDRREDADERELGADDSLFGEGNRLEHREGT